MVGDGPPCRRQDKAAARAMSDALDRLAHAYGIEPDYISGTGERRTVSDATKIALLEALGIPAADEEDVGSSLRSRAGYGRRQSSPRDARCFVPDWLVNGRVLGHHLPALQPPLGAEPRHRRFRGSRASGRARRGRRCRLHRRQPAARPVPCRSRAAAAPISPSSRRFLNPLYIAVDRLPQAAAAIGPRADRGPARHGARRLRRRRRVTNAAPWSGPIGAFLSGGQEERERLRGILRDPRQRAAELCAL